MIDETAGGQVPRAGPARGRTMQAIWQDGYGSADVLELRDIAVPEVADEQMLVRVRAAGVDRGAWHIMTGLPYRIRIAGYGVRAPRRPPDWERSSPASSRRSARR